MRLPSIESPDGEYGEILTFLYGLERFGILLGLENITELLERIGNPQWSVPVVHVTGSNGKGSTSSFVNEILREAGFKTALYTSPHLNDFRERIRVNGSMVSKEAIVASTRKVQEVYNPDRTTFFEFTTAVAFDCFAQARPDLAIVEVGLGGRLDATNTTSPIVTVITDVSREHEDYLGVGITSIAREKAGIIKRGVPVVSGATRREARAVIRDVAAKAAAPLKEFGSHFWCVRTGSDRFTYRSHTTTIEGVCPPLPGSYQIKNACIAIAVVEELIARGCHIPKEAISSGIEKTRFPGRFEIVRRKPDVIIDGAHTPEGLRLVKSAFRRLYPDVRPLLLLGILADKNYELLARIIAPLAKEVVCVPPQGNRALEPQVLARLIQNMGVPARSAPTINQGFDLLLQEASEQDVVLAAGSLYMIGPVRRTCGIADQ
jgi:dihydrofolate synthase/folylpolyglutamate synthase